jgi:deoxyadenosine/deoxycytidine kinase
MAKMFLTKPIIWVEGIIGSGKSTLSEKLGDILNLRVMREPVEENPYLDDFYKDPQRWAFAMQIHLLGIRAGLQDLAAEEVLWGTQYNGVVLDRGLPGDHAFCKLHVRSGNIHPREYDTYNILYRHRTNKLKPPSIMFFLDVEPEVALRRIKNRARGAEVNIDLQYLSDLRDQYYDLMVELQAGHHSWTGKVNIHRVPFNADHQSPDSIVSILKKEFPIFGGLDE